MLLTLTKYPQLQGIQPHDPPTNSLQHGWETGSEKGRDFVKSHSLWWVSMLTSLYPSWAPGTLSGLESLPPPLPPAVLYLPLQTHSSYMHTSSGGELTTFRVVCAITRQLFQTDLSLTEPNPGPWARLRDAWGFALSLLLTYCMTLG